MKSIEEHYNFFKDIPDEKWCVGAYIGHNGKRCALGHLTRGETPTYLLKKGVYLASINDGASVFKYLGDTPKERVLNSLVLASANLLIKARPNAFV